MGHTYSQNGHESVNNSKCGVCMFVLHNSCEKTSVYLDQDVINSQIEITRGNEAEFQNLPDPIHSFNEEEGIAVRKIPTQLVLDT